MLLSSLGVQAMEARGEKSVHESEPLKLDVVAIGTAEPPNRGE